MSSVKMSERSLLLSKAISHLRSSIASSKRPRLLERNFKGSAETSSKSHYNPGCITVMQWNIFAMALSQPEVCKFQCDIQALEWSSRKVLILEEILTRDPDLLAMQEVDDFEFMSNFLKSFGYQGIFMPKPRSPCLKMKNNIGPDGSAIFFTTNRFHMLDSGQEALHLDDGTRTNSELVWILVHDILLEKPLAFASTHLKAGVAKEFETTRFQQTKHLNTILQSLSTKASGNLICGGDFNGEPHERFYSKIYNIPGLNLRSAYRSVLNDTEPEYTTWKIEKNNHEVKRCIDYIWFTPGSLEVQEILNIPRDDQVGPKKFPSLNFPSDHLDLVALFKWK